MLYAHQHARGTEAARPPLARWAAPMVMLLRQLLAIAILPGSAAVLVPLWLARRRPPPAWPTTPLEMVTVAAGVLLTVAGLGVFGWCLRLFWRGRGTLAPWDPPRQFVAAGPYRYVRNPMITGVFLVLVGEAAILRSGAAAGWALLFAVINAVYIPLSEEPGLEARFGASYRAYCAAVPRFVPRRHPYPDA